VKLHGFKITSADGDQGKGQLGTLPNFKNAVIKSKEVGTSGNTILFLHGLLG
jgi:hypothetical protein